MQPQHIKIIEPTPKVTLLIVITIIINVAGLLLSAHADMQIWVISAIVLCLFLVELWRFAKKPKLLKFQADLHLSYRDNLGNWQNLEIENSTRVFAYFIILVGNNVNGRRMHWLFEKTQMQQDDWRQLNVFINAYRLEKLSDKNLTYAAGNDQVSK